MVKVSVDTGEEKETEKLLQKLKSGLIRNVSIGYRINDYEIRELSDRNTPDRLIARKWELMEVSLVAVQADPNAVVRKVDNDESQDENLEESKDVGEQLKDLFGEALEAAGLKPKEKTVPKKLEKALKNTQTNPEVEPTPSTERTAPTSETVVADPPSVDLDVERQRVLDINQIGSESGIDVAEHISCLLYTSPSPRDS